jgi:hypothetical protein
MPGRPKGTTPTVPHCVFCLATTKLTDEHIFGQWILDFIPTSMNKHTFANVKIAKPKERPEPSVRLRAGDPLSSKAKIVCAPCNTGWMSILQKAAKPFLLPLFRGERVTLDHHTQATVSAWIAMATMTGEYIPRDPAQVAISQSDRTWLMKTGTVPPNWRIWIGHYQRRAWSGQWVHSPLEILPAEDVPSALANDTRSPNTQTTTFVVGQLYVHAMNCRFDSIIYGWDWRTAPRARRSLFQISPSVSPFAFFPLAPLTDADAFKFATAFMEYTEDIASRE